MRIKFTKIKKAFINGLVLLVSLSGMATGEPSTWFNVFVPPNNDAVQRNVCLIVTAIQDSTYFSIVDDGMDGDTDDSKTGMLMAGQSYILYIKDNGINDDAKYASGGVLKQDGDYFTISATKLVYASQSTDSDWQHDWVPSVTKTGIGQKFIVYAPKISSSNRDLNVFAYSDSTQITIRKISLSATNVSGYTNVNMFGTTIVVQKMINIGQDLIYSSAEGRNLMSSGETYVIESSKPVTLQYGALFGNERDGGGYVPSSNGSSAGELFYFGVPFQSGTTGEQEIRVSSWDNANIVTLERFLNGSWISVKSWTINANSAGDWVGKNDGNVNYPTVFRLRCSAGKRVSVFEANWLETGNPGTSDIGTMASSNNGTSSGKDFLIYMAPPGNEQNVKNPFTNNYFAQQLTHAYLFSFNDTCIVSVKDAYTNGTDINRTYTVLPGRYADCYLTLNEWKSIYNGTGTTAGGAERPYLKISSTKPISVMNTNFNDNWMMYFGSSLEQSFNQTSSSTKDKANPGDTAVVSSKIVFNTTSNIDSAQVRVIVGNGVKVISSTLQDVTSSITITGTIQEQNYQTVITFPIQDSLTPSHTYIVTTSVVAELMYNNGALIPNNTVISVETDVAGKIDGINQQSSSVEGIQIVSANTSNLMFSMATFNSDLTNSWTANIVDVDNDGWDDIYVLDKDDNKPNLFYKNNGNKTFTKASISKLTTDKASSVCSSWADYDNDGDKDVLVVNNTKKPNALYQNNGSGSYTNLSSSPVANHPAYFHSGSFADYDNDGWLDVFVSNFMPTKFNELYHNNGNGTFSLVASDPVCSESFRSLGATWADYDNDGDQDLFVPNGDGNNNSLFKNNGNGSFSRQSTLNVCNDGGNSVASCWGDVNNDGWLDLFVSNASNENNFLYLNNKNGTFAKVSSGQAVNDRGHSHGCTFADFDNDMDLDLYVTNDQGNKFLYLNDGAGNLIRKKDEVTEANYGKSMGNYWFDADKDGDLDLFVPTHSNQPNYFFTNNGNSNNWISIKLTGSISNKDAIGARLHVKSGGKWQIREVNSQSGLGGQSSIRCHFGLGANSTIDSVYVKWPSGQTQYIPNLNVNTFNTITEPNGGSIKGIVYYDSNNNCVKDANENAISGIKLNLGVNFHAVSNSSGEYKAGLALGNYSLNAESRGVWVNTCSIPVVSVQTIGATYTVNIPLTATVTGVDLNVTMAATAMRRGFKNNLNLSLRNNGSVEAYNVPLSLQLDGNTSIKSSVPAYQSVSGNNYNWLIDTLKPGQVKSFTLLDSVYLSNQIGSTVNFTLSASHSGDLNLNDNLSTYSSEVVGAIDPNDLLVSPKGESDSGFVKKQTVLFYKVRFQNIGNYMASNVYVKDQLPEGLDYTQIQFVSSSHNGVFNYNEEGAVDIKFTDINLPDSTSDVLGSQGYVLFSVPVKNEVEAGDIIQNRADIQFDFEEPLSTNKVMNTIVFDSEKESLLVYPNPAESNVSLQLLSATEKYQSGNMILKLLVYGYNGQLLGMYENKEGINKLNLADKKPGIYQILAYDRDGKKYSAKVVISR